MGAVGGARSYKAVTLDLFGTLLDFRSILLSTLRRIMEENDLSHHVDEFRTKMRNFAFDGVDGGAFLTVREEFQRSLVSTLREFDVPGQLDTYAREVLDDMFDQAVRADLFPEVRQVLADLDTAGVHWGIVSNVDEDDLIAVIDNHALRPSTAVSSERVGSYKPDVRIFRVAMEEMGVTTDGVLHVGDSPLADVVGAQDAGLDVLWLNRYSEEFPMGLSRPTHESHDLVILPTLVAGG